MPAFGSRLALLLALPVLLALSGPTLADPPDFAPLERWIEQARRDAGHPSGIAVAVIAGGEVVHEAYSGLADLQRGVPVDHDTVFYIASATKPLFALTALLQARAGRVRTDTSLAAMFPDLDLRFDADGIDLADLLSHQSGLDNPALVWATAYSGVHDAASRRHLVALTTRAGETGRFDYGNVGYNLASVWLDTTLDEPWQAQLRRRVLQPLGMAHSTAALSEARAAGWPLALPYSLGSPDPAKPLYLRKVDATMHAAGGLLSTAPDLARFLIAQMPASAATAAPVLPAEVVALSQRRLVDIGDGDHEDFPRQGYAWGWYEGPYKGGRLLHHFGGFAGFHAHLSFLPERGHGLVILHNEDMLSPRLSALIADYVYGTLAGEAGIERRVEARFQALSTWIRRMRAAVAEQRLALAARPWRLALPRPAYAGRYHHDLLGTVTVQVAADGALDFAWGRLRGTATAYPEPELVRLEWVPNAGQAVRFEVAGQAVPALEFAGLRFQRVGEQQAEHRQPAGGSQGNARQDMGKGQ